MAEPYERRIYSAEHVLELLRLISERRVMRVGEAAEFLGVAPSTAHRLLGTLRHCGYVTQERRGGAYLPGETLHKIALAVVGADNIPVMARAILERLREEVQETVSLLLLEGNKVRFVDSIEGPGSLRVASRLGVVTPAHHTSGGKAMLALMPPEELRRLYPTRYLERSNAGRELAWDDLERDLASARRLGYCVNLQDGDQGIAALGAAVVDRSGVPVAAVAIACPNSRLKTKKAAAELSPALLGAVRAIEVSLGVGDIDTLRPRRLAPVADGA